MIDNAGVAIIHYGDPVVTMRCVSSLLSQIDPSQIVVIANSPVDADAFLGCHVVAQVTNQGYGGAVNTAARFAEDVGWTRLVVTNNDVVFLPASISSLFSEISLGDQQTVVAPLILWGDTDNVWSYGGYLSKWRAIGLNKLKSHPIPSGESRALLSSSTFISGCCFGAPVNLLREQPFETEYFLYYEDAKWCLDLERLSTVNLMVSKEAAIRHYPSSSTGLKTPLYLYYNTRNRMFFASAIGGFRGFVGLAYSLLGLLKNVIVQTIIGNKPGVFAVLKAWRDFAAGRLGRVTTNDGHFLSIIQKNHAGD